MKTLGKKSFYIFCVFLASSIFQSCLVYKKPPVQLTEATNATSYYFKKVKTIDGRVFHLRTLGIQGNQVYGSTTKKGELKKLGFSVEEIEFIRLQNKQLSNVGNAFIVVGLVIVASWVFWITVVKPQLDFNFGTFSYP